MVAIDFLTRKSVTPILVGDIEDMEMLALPRTQRDSSGLYLAFGNSDDSSQRLKLSEVAAENLSYNECILLVALDQKDTIAWARLCPLDDDVSPIRELREDEIKRVAEDLVAGDFNLDFFR